MVFSLSFITSTEVVSNTDSVCKTTVCLVMLGLEETPCPYV